MKRNRCAISADYNDRNIVMMKNHKNIFDEIVTHAKRDLPIESDIEHRKLDITEDQCPITFVKVKVELAKLQEGDLLEVLLNPGEPLKNVPRSAVEQGHKVHEIEPDRDFFRVFIEKGKLF